MRILLAYMHRNTDVLKLIERVGAREEEELQPECRHGGGIRASPTPIRTTTPTQPLPEAQPQTTYRPIRNTSQPNPNLARAYHDAIKI